MKPNKDNTKQKGQVLALVLILLFLGSTLIVTLLSFATTGAKSGLVYVKKTDELYAADAGIEDAIWQIKYDYLDTFLTNPAYSPYDFSTKWTYSASDNVNAKEVNIAIENTWVPKNISVPSEAEARAIAEAEKLIITSGNGTSDYIVRVTYYPEVGEDLMVESLGVWLPRGFSYVEGSSNLEGLADNVTVEPHAGNQAVLWNFSSVPFNDFPGVNPLVSPRITEVTFQFDSSQPGAEPDTVAWITTSGVADIPFSWESNVKVYGITSQAGGTAISSYMAKSEARLLRSGIAGDYKATGNSLMTDEDSNPSFRETWHSESSAAVSDIPLDATVRAAYLYWSGWRSGVIFFDSSDNFTAWDKGDAWSLSSDRFRGHYDSGSMYEEDKYLTLGNSVNLTSYTPGTVSVMWNQDEGGSLESSDILYFAFSSDNGSSWSANYLAFQNDNPPETFTYTVPGAYLTDSFKLRFYISGFADSGSGGTEYCYLDNFTITTSEMIPDTSVVFKIDSNQVFFSDNGTPEQGAQEIVADWSDYMENYIGATPEGYSYVGFKDVTALVKAFSAKAPDPAVNRPGNAIYTVGSVAADTISTSYSPGENSYLSYAGWSLVLIYSSVETQGHSLYLYDSFMHSGGDENIDFDDDGQPGGIISGFIVPEPIEGEVNAAKLTVFVGEGDEQYSDDYLAFNDTKLWDGTNTTGNSAGSPNNAWNGESLGMSADGVDVDTFYVTWESGLLLTGHTSAQIDVPTDTDEWNLVYIILAFRSEPRAGGALNYMIE
ncbi:hypothetical protein ACFLU1_04975 [Chloroflexota bacterium]